MRTTITTLAAALILASGCDSSSPVDVPIAADAGADLGAHAADATPAVDATPATVDSTPAQPVDTRPQAPADLRPRDALPPTTDATGREAAQAAPDSTPASKSDTGSGLSFQACLWQGQRIHVMKAGAYCGQYPQLGPNGGITCYTGCKVESMMETSIKAPANAQADTSDVGYCSSSVDNYAASGSQALRLGLCFATAEACATVCP